ncbi:OmpW/AlkL family protein [Pseudorhodoferax sp.]|uniref:OmpW/AlkL family protein n=1 Tax=Pseudorhodoferax sp. TaxID=1993553 RepID=UPI0039E520E8
MHAAPRFPTRLLAATALAAAAASPAWAQKAGDVFLGAGWLRYSPQEESTPLRFTQPVQREVPGSGSSIPSVNTLGLNVHYFFTDNFAIEGVLGVPPKLKLDGAGSLAGLGKLGNARLYGPSVLAKYFFGQSSDRLRVGVGAGVTYARFADTQLSQNLQSTLGATLGLPPGASTTSAKIDSRFGPVVSVGVNYAVTDRLGLTASISYVHMKTKATLSTTAGGRVVAVSESSLKLNPIIPFVYATYRF